MGDNNLETKNPGDVISADDPNQYKTSETEDKLPRNSSGVPTDDAGGLGSSLYRWGSSFIKKITFGTAANAWAITETGDELVMTQDGTTRFKITATGFDASYIQDGTGRRLQIKKVTSTQSVTWPSDIDGHLFALGTGGGGGGGGGGDVGGGSDVEGGSGGEGVEPHLYLITGVTPGGSDTITVGAGGPGGSAGVSGSGGNGTAGGQSTVGSYATFLGGRGGSGGGTVTGTVNAGYTTANNLQGWRIGSGSGGNESVGTNTATDGSDSTRATGGTEGSVRNVLAGGGGGGAGFENGGDGGDGEPSTGGTGPTAGGAGAGGGGGGAESGAGVADAGAAGGDGEVWLICVTAEAWEGTV